MLTRALRLIASNVPRSVSDECRRLSMSHCARSCLSLHASQCTDTTSPSALQMAP